MALIQCPECGKRVSDEKGACPECGFIFFEVKKDSNPFIRFCENNVALVYVLSFGIGWLLEIVQIGNLLGYLMAGAMGILAVICICELIFGFAGQRTRLFVSLALLSAGYWISFGLPILIGLILGGENG